MNITTHNPGTEKILPGTLFAITPEQSSAIELGILLGKKLQGLLPEIATDYRAGDSASKIIKKHDLIKLLGYKYKVVESAVFRAIRGYDGSMQAYNIEQYDGLITDREEIKKLGENHNVESGRLVGNDMVKNGKGIFALTKKERLEASRLGAIACGRTPYSKKEFAFIKKLANDPTYLKGKLLHVQKIATEVNEKFHNGTEVRLPKSITKLLIRKKIRNEIAIIHSEEELTFITDLVNNPKYQKGKNSLLIEICKEVNAKFHDNKEVRTPNGINKVITRKKLKKQPEDNYSD